MTSRIAMVLEETGQEIDITAAARDAAIARYHHLGDWLVQEQKGVAGVEVYAQGSFRLGTVIRPIDDSGDFDIDLVFRRDLARTSITQDELRKQAGELLKRYCRLHGHDDPIELGRCWRLEFFDDGFHLDVLPVIPDENMQNDILLSDRELRHWLYSNPIGYATWFYSRMNAEDLQSRRVALALKLNRNVEDVPEFLVRTPLQRVVQLLKRGRDEYFIDRIDEAPTSILITTLAARAYTGQTDIALALDEVTRRLADTIENRNGTWWVSNPAHPEENFADKWNLFPERRHAFYEWQAKTITALDQASSTTELERAGSYLSEAFGARVDEVTQRIASRPPQTLLEAARGIGRAPGEQFIEDRFPKRITGTVTVTFEVADPAHQNRMVRRAELHTRRLSKERQLRFTMVKTDIDEPYDVYWKVRNFGRQAALATDGLRGKLLPDEGNHERIEHTKYTGEHYVDCYIVRNGACVAARRTWVPIA